MEDKVRIAQDTGVLPNHLNTEKHRMNKNLGRAMKRSKAAMENRRAADKFDDLDTRLTDARATVRAIEQEKKQLREETGLKRRPRRTAKLGQHLPDIDGDSGSGAASMSTPMQAPVAVPTTQSSTGSEPILSQSLLDHSLFPDTHPYHPYQAATHPPARMPIIYPPHPSGAALQQGQCSAYTDPRPTFAVPHGAMGALSHVASLSSSSTTYLPSGPQPIASGMGHGAGDAAAGGSGYHQLPFPGSQWDSDHYSYIHGM